MTTQTTGITTATLALCLLFLAPLPGRSGEQPDAADILNTAGIEAGLIVLIPSGKPVETARLAGDLAGSGNFLIHVLAPTADNASATRALLLENGVSGQVSVAHGGSDHLPYVDHFTNLVICEHNGLDQEEAMRVLAPLGMLLARDGTQWKRVVKSWPDDIDEWTHFLHGPDNNAVADDSVVGPPTHLQWIAGPRHLRTHEHLNSISSLVSTGGRIFYILDEGPTASVAAPTNWKLVARDAFNGLLLWKSELGPWEGHFRLFRSGPADIGRRLVAVGDRVYVTLGYGEKVAAFDTTTGERLREYDGTEGAIEILCKDDRLYVVVGAVDGEGHNAAAKKYLPAPEPRAKGIVVVDAGSGDLLWERRDADTEELMPTAMALGNKGHLFFQNTTHLLCLDASTGSEKWRVERPSWTTRLSWSSPTLVAAGDVVLSADGSTGGLPVDVDRGASTVKWVLSDQDIRKHPVGDIIAFSAETGERLWTGDSVQGFNAPGDVFVIDDLVWNGGLVGTKQRGLDVARDLKTGEVKHRPTGGLSPVAGHARCYRNKATKNFLVLGGMGVEMVDVNDWSFTADNWLRGTCQYGVMPCNGLLYIPPDSCACRPNARLHGFTAMAPRREAQEKADTTDPMDNAVSRLEPGPAAGRIDTGETSSENVYPWPTYRRDNARSGRSSAAIPRQLAPAWENEIGGRITPPTIGAGKVFVSQIDTNTVYAIDTATGATAWKRTVGSRVDSPPTISNSVVVFGCRDGSVHCLRAADGESVWRFRAGPEDRFLLAHERVESVWPVHGSVLVRDNQVWFAAGRSAWLDGGLRLYALDLLTGLPVVARRLDARHPDSLPPQLDNTGRPAKREIPGALPDILSSIDDTIYMGATSFDLQGNATTMVKPHLFSATGFLDDTWWHRTYWQYGTWMRGGFGGWPQAAISTPSARLMVMDDELLFGFGRSQYDAGNTPGFKPGPDDPPVKGVHAGHIGVLKKNYQDMGHVDHSENQMRLYCTPRTGWSPEKRPKGPWIKNNVWESSLNIIARSMVLAGRDLVVAGPVARPDNATLGELDKPLPSRIQIIATGDGGAITECDLPAQPVLDGIAVMPGHLVLSCVDGAIRCYGSTAKK